MGKKNSNKKSRRSDAERRLRQASRLADHLRLLQLLLGRGRWDAKTLASELECTERTVYRYLKVLEFAGVPYYFDKKYGYYRVPQGVKFPILNLTSDEILQHAAVRAVSDAVRLGDHATSYIVSEKLAATMVHEKSKLLAESQKVVTAIGSELTCNRRHHETLHTIQQALVDHKQLAIGYGTPHKPDEFELVLHPYRLCLLGQVWYLIASGGNDLPPKTYRVARCRSAEKLNVAAETPEEFDLDGYFGNAWRVYRDQEAYDVSITFTAEVTELVTETNWHKTQEVSRWPDGRVTLSFTVDGLNEIIWWVLGWSGYATVERPPQLQQMVVEHLELALRKNR